MFLCHPLESSRRKTSYILTLTIYVSFFMYGLAFSMIAPARLYVSHLVNSDFNHISIGPSLKSAGYCIGAIMFGYLFTKISKQIGLSLIYCIIAGIMVAIPFIRVLWIYLMSEFIFGFISVGVDVACNSWILEIWHADANPFMQGLHFALAFGMTVGPLIEGVYLRDHVNGTETITESPYENSTTDGPIVVPMEENRIATPFTIGSSCMIFAAALLIVLFFKIPQTPGSEIKNHKDKKVSRNRSSSSCQSTLHHHEDDVREKKKKANTCTGSFQHSSTSLDVFADAASSSSSSCDTSSNGKVVCDDDETQSTKSLSSHEKTLISLASLLLCFYMGIQSSTMDFIPVFGNSIKLKMSESSAAFLSSFLSGAFAVNCLVSIFIATKIKSGTMLFFSFSVILVGNFMLFFFANTSLPMLYAAVIVIGAGCSCVVPCIMSFIEERVKVTTFVCGLFMLSTCVSSVAVPLLIGKYVQTYPMTYVYVNVAGISICTIVFAVLYFVDHRHQARIRQSILTNSLSHSKFSSVHNMS